MYLGFPNFEAGILDLADEAIKFVKNTLALLSFKGSFDIIVGMSPD